MSADRTRKYSPTPHSAGGPVSPEQVHSSNLLSARFFCKSTSFASLVLLISGCTSVANLHPLYSPEVKADEPTLAGDWFLNLNEQRQMVQLHPPSLPGAPWTVTVINYDDSGKYSGYLLCLGDSLFIELTPDDPEAPRRNAIMPPPPHSFYRLQLAGDTLRVAPIDPKWVQKHLKRDQFVQHKTGHYETQIIILGSTEELQAFLRLHAADSSAFSVTIPLTRKAASHQNEGQPPSPVDAFQFRP